MRSRCKGTYAFLKSNVALPLIFLGTAAQTPTVVTQSAGTFTATGSMITPRFRHTAALLPNGKVLIAGGNNVCFISFPPCLGESSTELYDPVAGTFTPTSNMSSADQRTGGFFAP